MEHTGTTTQQNVEGSKNIKKSRKSQMSSGSARNYYLKEINALIHEQIAKALRNPKKSSKGSKKSHNDQSGNSFDLEGSDSGGE